MGMSDNTEWKRLRKLLKKQGCQIEGGGDKHFKVFQGKRLITTMPSSPGGGRALRNQKAQLRREGFKV